MEDKIKQMLDDYGLTESQLTCENLINSKRKSRQKNRECVYLTAYLIIPHCIIVKKINLYVKKQQKISNKTPKPKTLFANKQNSTKN